MRGSLGAVVLLAACSRGPRPAVAVVGGGPAGMAAAIEASACADVTLFEGRGQLGGSALYGDAVTAVPSEAELAALDAESGPNPARARFVARVTPDVLDWTRGFGVSWRELPVQGEAGTRLYEPEGGGVAVVTALAKALDGVTLRLGTKVDGLERAPGTQASAGMAVRVGADRVPVAAVVLATGGFAGNLDRVREKLALGDTPLLRGAAAFADGNGIALATALGGVEVEPSRLVLYAHGTPSPDDPARALMVVDGAHVYPIDPAGTYLPAVQTPRGASGDALRGLPGAWAVVDDKAIDHIPLWDGDRRAAVPMGPAAAAAGLFPSPEALAVHLGLPVTAVTAGVVASNRDARPDHPLLASSRRWAALPLRLTTAKSLTGVWIDLDGRALDAHGVALPGLYAAGELAGFAHPWERTHVDSTMVSGAILTGRAAGRAVCADLAK